MFTQVTDLVTRGDAKLADFDARIVSYDGLPAGTSDNDRFKALRAAEIVISTKPEPSPANPAALRTLLDGKGSAFADRRDQFAAVLASSGAAFTGFLAAVSALLPVSDFDAPPFD